MYLATTISKIARIETNCGKSVFQSTLMKGPKASLLFSQMIWQPLIFHGWGSIKINKSGESQWLRFPILGWNWSYCTPIQYGWQLSWCGHQHIYCHSPPNNKGVLVNELIYSLGGHIELSWYAANDSPLKIVHYIAMCTRAPGHCPEGPPDSLGCWHTTYTSIFFSGESEFFQVYNCIQPA